MKKMNDDIVVKRKPIYFGHDVTYYVPVFQKDFEDDGELCGYPHFIYSMENASTDEQMAWSFSPDYVLTLKGYFDATTKPLIIKNEL